MDKYQKYIFDKFDHNKVCYIFFRCCPIEDDLVGSTAKYGVFDSETDSFCIKQDDNINKTKYVLIIPSSVYKYTPRKFTAFSGVFVFKNNQWNEIACENEQYRIIIDFNDRIEAIKFVFTNQIATDYVLKITYEEADKEKYFAKIEKDRKETLEKNANIKVSTGMDLVNIYFQPCCDQYDHTEILLYIPNEEVHRGYRSNNAEIIEVLSWSLIKKCQVLADDFYQSINGLAYGKYAFILKQYDKNNNLILETDYIPFVISKPETPTMGHAVVI